MYQYVTRPVQTFEFPVFLIDIYVKIYLASYNLLVIDEYQVNKLVNELNLPTDFHVKCIFHLYYLNWKVLFETRNWWYLNVGSINSYELNCSWTLQYFFAEKLLQNIQYFCCLLGEDVKGIPHFWLTVFKNVDMLSEMVQVCSFR